MPRVKYFRGELIPLTAEEETARDAEEAAFAAAAPIHAAMREIERLEATVTQRRLRDAHLTQAGADWLAAVEAEIAVQRAIIGGG